MSEQSDALIQRMAEIGPCIVAFSGGVDSSVVAAAGHRALGEQCLAVTGVSPAVSHFDRQYAAQVAQQIGIRHRIVDTFEQEDPLYVQNDQRRCYHCKNELFSRLRVLADRENYSTIVTGTNSDDLTDYRPGLVAGNEHAVQTPLADMGYGKSIVRQIALEWQLAVAHRPAAPCLASRIAYGVQADHQALAMVEAAEAYLRGLGFGEFRVRLHADRLARIELADGEMTRFLETVPFAEITQRFITFGFRFVTLDLQGLRSGSMNRVLGDRSLPIVS